MKNQKSWKNTERNERKIRRRVNGIMFAAGVSLTAVFLISDRWMKSPVVCDRETGEVMYQFNIGFHWSTLVGMLGVILLVTGVMGFAKAGHYILGQTALTVSIVNLCSWEYLFSASETYFDLVLQWSDKIVHAYYFLKVWSVVFTLFLFLVMIAGMDRKRDLSLYRGVSVIVLVTSAACLLFVTVCNHWYLLETALAVLGIVLVSGGRTLYEYMKEKKNRKEENYALCETQ